MVVILSQKIPTVGIRVLLATLFTGCSPPWLLAVGFLFKNHLKKKKTKTAYFGLLYTDLSAIQDDCI